MPDAEFWDTRYAADTYAYGTRPNRGLEAIEPTLPRGARVLLPGDGEGRNSVWLAQRGHSVLAVDMAAEGLRKAGRLAADAGVAIEVLQADLAEWFPPDSEFDALVLVFVHLPPQIRRAAHRRLLAALKPGGLLFLEGFERSHAGLPGGGPRDPAWLFDAETLREDFAGCTQLSFEVLDTHLDEGPFHQGRARVLRAHGQR